MSKGELKQGDTPAARSAIRRAESVARCIGLMLLLAAGAWTQPAAADASGVIIGAGGPISSVVFDPQFPTALYAISRSCGGVKSTDGGDTWVVSDISLPDTVTAFAFDPITPSTRYAGTPNGVYKSTGAATRGWEAVNTGLRNTAVNALAIDPTVPTTLYAGTDGGFAGISKSTDGANNWRTVNSGIPYQQYEGIGALAIDPFAPTTLYAGGAACDGRRCIGLMLKSTNAAVSWQTVNTGLPNTTDAACEYCIGTILALVMDPTTPTTLYAGTARSRRCCTCGSTRPCSSSSSAARACPTSACCASETRRNKRALHDSGDADDLLPARPHVPSCCPVAGPPMANPSYQSHRSPDWSCCCSHPAPCCPSRRWSP
jgi:hypothetical protein